MAIVVGVVAIISTFFYSNMSGTEQDFDPITEYTKFNSFFSDEANHSNIKVLECGTTENGQNYIVFDNGVQYTFIPENQGIYRNHVKIANGVTNCTFTRNIKNGKDVVDNTSGVIIDKTLPRDYGYGLGQPSSDYEVYNRITPTDEEYNESAVADISKEQLVYTVLDDIMVLILM